MGYFLEPELYENQDCKKKKKLRWMESLISFIYHRAKEARCEV